MGRRHDRDEAEKKDAATETLTQAVLPAKGAGMTWTLVWQIVVLLLALRYILLAGIVVKWKRD